jgi:hypothetical protein
MLSRFLRIVLPELSEMIQGVCACDPEFQISIEVGWILSSSADAVIPPFGFVKALNLECELLHPRIIDN